MEQRTGQQDGFIYLIRREELTKIGMAVNYERRFAEIHRSTRPSKLVGLFETADRRKDEKVLHEMFADKRVTGEWFNLDSDDIESVARYFDAPFDWQKDVPILPASLLYREVKCLRCGNKWKTKLERPATCTSCHSYHWNKPKAPQEAKGEQRR